MFCPRQRAEAPLNVAKGLWGGAFPEVESMEDLNRLIDTLINGLWNALTIHQKRNEPFRLVKVPLEPSVANLAQLARNFGISRKTLYKWRDRASGHQDDPMGEWRAMDQAPGQGRSVDCRHVVSGG
jgi:hypothetical protein